MSHILLIVGIFWTCLLLLMSKSSYALLFDKKSLLACQAAMPDKSTSSHTTECSTNSDGNTSDCTSSSGTDFRTIAIGDIHGSYDGLLENLYYANVTVSKTKCDWKQQSTPTILVQMGDYVDRGPGALETIKCVRKLQEEASLYNAEVVRIVGSKCHFVNIPYECLLTE